jgi:hypothetical protein
MNLRNQNENQNKNDTSSLALDLETLSAKYKSLLTKYRQSVLDYIENLKQESSRPCEKYNANSTNISQECYEEIWRKSGCTTTGFVNASGDWARARTLNELIWDSFGWATLPTDRHRSGCYGVTQNGNPYFLLALGTNGRLHISDGVTHWHGWNTINSETPFPFTVVNDDAANDIASICMGNDGKMVIATNRANRLFYKPTWDAPKWIHITNQNCCVSSVAMGQDGTLVGVGTDGRLYSKFGNNGSPNLNGNWTLTSSSEWISGICIGPDGSIFCIGGGNTIWKKNSYKNLAQHTWQFQGNNTCCVKAITIAPDGTFIGVGMDNKIYTKDNYQNLTTPWKGPYTTLNGSGYDIIGVAAFVNSNYDASKYNNNKEPNFNINAPTLGNIKGQAFWGTHGLTGVNSNSLQECSALCSSDNRCTGATFNPDKRLCWTRGGPGSTMPALPNDYAIIPKSKQLLDISDSINRQINNVNRQMQIRIDQLYSIYGRQIEKRNSNDYNLINEYNNLNSERKKINEIIKEYQTLEQTENESSIFISKNYYLFFTFLLVSFLTIIVLYFCSIDPQTSANTIKNVNNITTNVYSVASKINPYYVMFGIILLVTISHLYNTYITSIYNNAPSLQNMGQLGAVYFVFFVVLIFIAISYFKKQ